MRKKNIKEIIIPKVIALFLALVSVLTIGKWLKKYIKEFKKDDEGIKQEELDSNYHEHTYQKWQKIDDYLEESRCIYCHKVEERYHHYNVITNNINEKVVKTYICPNCHNEFKTIKDNNIDNYNHKWSLIKKDDLFEYYECSICKQTKCLNHNYEMNITSNGYKNYCSQCGYSYQELGYHEHQFILTNEDNIYEYYTCFCGENLKIEKQNEQNNFEKDFILQRIK